MNESSVSIISSLVPPLGGTAVGKTGRNTTVRTVGESVGRINSWRLCDWICESDATARGSDRFGEKKYQQLK
jgi:hypothetical protein